MILLDRIIIFQQGEETMRLGNTLPLWFWCSTAATFLSHPTKNVPNILTYS